MTAEFKLASQQNMFPTQFRHQEEGIRQISKAAGLEEAGDESKEMELSEGDSSRTVKINKNLPKDFKKELLSLFIEKKYVFAWDHTELKGIDPRVCQHRIPLKMDARPVRM